MSIHVALHHRTTYRTTGSWRSGPQVVRLRPAPHCRTADPVLLAEGRAGAALHQLAAGPAGQLPGAARLPGEDRRASRSTVDLVAEMAVFNPFDFFLEPERRELPVRLRCRARRASSRRISQVEPRRAAARGIPRQGRSRSDAAHHRLPRRAQPAAAAGHRLPRSAWSRACRRRRRRCATPSGSCRDSGWLLVQLLRHLGLAARFVSGYLIQLTPDVKSLDGPAGTDARLHRPARLVRGLSARRRLDRPRPDLRPARRRGPHPARLHARARRAPRRSTGAVDEAEVEFDHDMKVHAHLRDAARHQALHRRAVGRDRWRSATRSTRARGRRRAPDHGRRADLRLDRRPRRRRMEHRRRWARPSARSPAS